jgi:hypothetical protein
MKAALSLLRRYAAADDPRVAAANVVALVLAWNTPFYPLYLLGAAGASIRDAACLTLCSFPLFLAVPAITRWNPLLGRVVLVLGGTANTLFCTWVLSEASGTALFLLPCITLAALLFRRTEIKALAPLLLLPILAGVVLNGRYPYSPFACGGEACAAILWLNALSVAVLLAFLGLLATGMVEGDIPMRSADARPRHH